MNANKAHFQNLPRGVLWDTRLMYYLQKGSTWCTAKAKAKANLQSAGDRSTQFLPARMYREVIMFFGNMALSCIWQSDPLGIVPYHSRGLGGQDPALIRGLSHLKWLRPTLRESRLPADRAKISLFYHQTQLARSTLPPLHYLDHNPRPHFL